MALHAYTTTTITHPVLYVSHFNLFNALLLPLLTRQCERESHFNLFNALLLPLLTRQCERESLVKERGDGGHIQRLGSAKERRELLLSGNCSEIEKVGMIGNVV